MPFAIKADDGLFDYPYGFRSDREYDELTLELRLFYINWQGNKAYHFKKVARMLWPEDARPPVKPFVWHPWAEKMLELACKWQYLGIVGSASSGKSMWAAMWAVVSWLAAPRHTMVLVTSTSLTDSRKRIWGDIKNLVTYSALGDKMPCKIIDSKGLILTDSGNGNYSDKEGIALIPGAPDQAQDSIGKMIGIKAQNVLLIADELPELSPAIIEAGKSNLSAQVDPAKGQEASFQLIALGNFASIYDPLGDFVRPKNGYGSINPNMDGWETELGYCLRLDGLKSPNVLAGEDKWPIYGCKQLEQHRKTYDEKSLLFWRMVRSFPCPEGMDDVIYSDAHFLQARAHDRIQWAYPPTRVAGFDPSFTNGGDRSVCVLGSCGEDVDGNNVIQIDRVVKLTEDVTKKDRTRNFQIAEAFRDLCVSNQVLPQHAGMDATAGGTVLHDIVSELWSNQVLPVQFGGAASEFPVNATDLRPAHEHYANRVTELWYFGVELLAGHQLKGMTDEIAREMKARKYETTKNSANVRVRVEPKKDMKERVGFSPDIADSLFTMITVCRERLGLVAGATRNHVKRQQRETRNQMQAQNELYDSVDYSEQDPEEVYATYDSQPY